MQITVKKLNGTSFEIEAKPQHTVADVKKNIESVKGGPDVYPAARQMLIHGGKVLKDETTLEENKVDENGFIVVMLSKNKSSCGETSTAAAAAAAAAVSETSCTPAPSSPPEAPSTTAAAVPSVSVHPTQAAAGGGMPNANALNLFPQDLGDRMVTRVSGRTRTNLDILRNDPQFQTFRAIVRANPQLLQMWMGELREHHPGVARYIRERQDDFDSLMNEGREDQVGGNFSLTIEEMVSIQRLEGMGFERSLVIHAFMACEKNEEQAANYLLDHMDEE